MGAGVILLFMSDNPKYGLVLTNYLTFVLEEKIYSDIQMSRECQKCIYV